MSGEDNGDDGNGEDGEFTGIGENININRRPFDPIGGNFGGGGGGGGGDGNGGDGGDGNGGDGDDGDGPGNVVEIPEQTLATLQKDVANLNLERNNLQGQIEALRERNQKLEQHLQDVRKDQLQLRPNQVISELGRSLDQVESDLEESNYEIGDFNIELKANVVAENDELRFHLPSAEEDFASENLSTISLQMKRQSREQPLDNPEVPDLREMSIGEARRRIRKKGFEVGTGADAESGVVIDQYPSPFSVAERGTTIDLTVSEEEASNDGA